MEALKAHQKATLKAHHLEALKAHRLEALKAHHLEALKAHPKAIIRQETVHVRVAEIMVSADGMKCKYT